MFINPPLLGWLGKIYNHDCSGGGMNRSWIVSCPGIEDGKNELGKTLRLFALS